ncbi:hypothetical protein BO94DRAFT_549914 [Aspergillus sclerotioniger CBS 115572]|uniref:DUF7580 domain-containing protein n=1 Tax=Aspergillus sclerotioniger CBS 115572 TaxID=1450535 RepID=A0A317VFF1_9EURO|nr:hypothetical protein BO94DRAFT_549914 [Aspergillus sclerotioniger CBS 115572]PWY73114.1 hypothetical protein BO94DRAFT_549914 [Aspergillus sclerotioniger CBS 115572]
MRFRLWGESQGLGSSPRKPSKNSTIYLPEVQDLIFQRLGHVIQLFEKQFHTIDAQVVSHKPKICRSDNVTPLTLSIVLDAKRNLEHLIAEADSRTRILTKSLWSTQKESDLLAIVTDLMAVNNDLGRLILPNEADALAHSLTGEMLSATPNLPPLYEYSFGPCSSKTTEIIRLRQLDKVCFPKAPDPKVQAIFDAASAHWNIPISALDKCIDGIDVKNIASFDGKIWDGSDVRSSYIYTPPGDDPKQIVLVEWHLQAECLISHALAKRCQHLASLLHRTAAADDDFRVLLCLGSILTKAWHDGKQYPLVGIVYEKPQDATFSTRTLTLAEALRNGSVPNLNERFRLAQQISLGVYQLHCAGWIHRRLSGNNILIFSRSDGKYDVTRPYIGGWQYVRSDFDPASKSEWNVVSCPHVLDSAAYIHPDRLKEDANIAQLQKIDDIYSLGVLLIEIAVWNGAQCVADPKKAMVTGRECRLSNHRQWCQALWETSKNGIGAIMGAYYCTAVASCLGRLDYTDENDESLDENIQNGNDLEEGIEKWFFYRVVDKLREMPMDANVRVE